MTTADTIKTAATPILEVRDLAVAYRTSMGPVRAVRGVSFDVGQSETVSLVGETGSGKSTIALGVLGLLDQTDTSGEILYRGRDIRSFTAKEWQKVRGSEIGIVFQDARSAMNPVRTLLDHLVETLGACGVLSKKDSGDKARGLLREVGIPEAQERLYPFELSGGTCQRAGIALGICNGPRFLIADEPTSAIDAAIQAQILELLQRMKERYGLALLWISHDLPLMSHVSDRIMVMYHGRIVESGLKEEVLGSPAHPYTVGLVQCQPSFLHDPHSHPLTAIPGSAPKGGQEFRGCAFAPRCGRSEPRCLEALPPVRRLSKTHAAECVVLEQVV